MPLISQKLVSFPKQRVLELDRIVGEGAVNRELVFYCCGAVEFTSCCK